MVFRKKIACINQETFESCCLNFAKVLVSRQLPAKFHVSSANRTERCKENPFMGNSSVKRSNCECHQNSSTLQRLVSIKRSHTLKQTLYSFFIKNIFYDKMELRLFYFDVVNFKKMYCWEFQMIISSLLKLKSNRSQLGFFFFKTDVLKNSAIFTGKRLCMNIRHPMGVLH